MRPKKKPSRRAAGQIENVQIDVGSPVDGPAEAVDASSPGRAIVLTDRSDNNPVLPETLPLLPLRSDVVFPQTVVPLVVNRPGGIRLIDDVLSGGGDKMLGLRHPAPSRHRRRRGSTTCTRRSASAPSSRCSSFPTARPGSSARVCSVPGWSRSSQTEPYLSAGSSRWRTSSRRGSSSTRLVHHVNRLFQRMVDQSQQVPEELQVAAMNTREPGRLADLLGSSLPFTIEEKQKLLGEINVRARLEKLGQFLSRQLAVLELSSKIQEQVGSEITKAQRDHFLRQQIKAIQEELGEGEPREPRARRALGNDSKAAEAPRRGAGRGRARDRAAGGMHPSSAEYSIVRTYLDWMAVAPLDELEPRPARPAPGAEDPRRRPLRPREDQGTDPRIPGRPQAQEGHERADPLLRRARRARARPRWARASPRPSAASSSGSAWAACTTRPRSAATAAPTSPRCPAGSSRESARRGRTTLSSCSTRSTSSAADFRGDPSAALLEVLDPEQNATFRDHYLDVDFDLSKVMFIATANMLETIPAPLLDRMEVLQLPGYSEEEKTLIAQNFIIPKQLEAHGLTLKDVTFGDDAVRKIIADYTREAGLRNLEREIAAICRKVARKHAEGTQETDGGRARRRSRSRSARLAFSARSPTGPARRASRPAWPGRRPAARSSSSRRPGCPAREC